VLRTASTNLKMNCRFVHAGESTCVNEFDFLLTKFTFESPSFQNLATYKKSKTCSASCYNWPMPFKIWAVR